jgi:hypothetical protein
MIFFSVADACRHLGSDPTPVHRWLARAHLSLQAHPGDGRTHGLSEDHLRQLARLHQRALPLLPAVPPAPVSATRPPLPPELLVLPQTLSALHAQLTALQQQVADLTHLLQPPAPASQAKAARWAAQPAPAAPHSRRAAAAATTPPRKPVHVFPRVEWGGDGHDVVLCPTLGVFTLESESSAWCAWLATQSSCRVVGQHGHFTAHHEVLRVPHGAWRASTDPQSPSHPASRTDPGTDLRGLRAGRRHLASLSERAARLLVARPRGAQLRQPFHTCHCSVLHSFNRPLAKSPPATLLARLLIHHQREFQSPTREKPACNTLRLPPGSD